MGDQLRLELATDIRGALPAECKLEAIAREMDGLGPAIRWGTWTRPNAVDAETRTALLRTALRVIDYQPDLTLLTDQDQAQVYMQRWWLSRESAPGGGGQYGLYVHVFESDDPQDLHNHPWPSVSLLLAGCMFDNNASYRHTLREAALLMRSAGYKHRVTLPREGPAYLHAMMEAMTSGKQTAKAITLIATGRRTQRGWGFETPDGRIERVDTKPTAQGAILNRRP